MQLGRNGVVVAIGALVAACEPDPVPQPTLPWTTTLPSPDGIQRLGGIARYEIANRDGDGVVLLRGDDGSVRGTLFVTASASAGTVVSLVADDGSVAEGRAFIIEGGGAGFYWTRFRLAAEGQALETDALATDDHVILRVQLAVSTGAATVDGGEADGSDGVADAGSDGGATGGSDVAPDELAPTFVAVDQGVAVDPAHAQAWLEGAGIERLLSSRAARLLALVRLDERIGGALAGLQAGVQMSAPAGVLVQGIHKSSDCALVSSLASTASSSCIGCLASLASAPATGGTSLIVSVGTCAACGGLAVGGLVMYVQCSRSAADATTLPDCIPYCQAAFGLAYDAAVNETEHGCRCDCNSDKCAALWRKRLLPGQSLCSAACLGDNRCTGKVQTCGDGAIDSVPGCAAEECDPGARPNGCGPNKTCKDCKCADEGLQCGAVRCAPGQECHGCETQLLCAAPGSTCCLTNYGYTTCPPGQVCRDCSCVQPGQSGMGCF